MSWKAVGHPTVRKQRDKWVVRIDGIDTATGKHRPRQLGTYASQRSALSASREQRAEARSTERRTVGWLVRRYVAGKSDITPKAREQYAWAIPHIERGLGAIPLARLDRDDVADWINALANEGTLSRRSVQICRNVLRASLADAVEEGLIPRSPAARVALPRTVAKPVREKVVQAWEATDVDKFLAAIAEHRWAVGFQLGVLYGLRRSEVLALRWDDFDPRAAHFESTKASSQSTAGQFSAMPRTCDHAGSFLCPTTGCALSNDAAPSKPKNDYSPVRSGKTTTSSSPPDTADSYSPVPTTDRWPSSSTKPSCHV